VIPEGDISQAHFDCAALKQAHTFVFQFQYLEVFSVFKSSLLVFIGLLLEGIISLAVMFAAGMIITSFVFRWGIENLVSDFT